MLNFLICTDNNYFLHTRPLVTSILANHKDEAVNIFIAHSEKADSRFISELKIIVSKYENAKISFIEIADQKVERLHTFFRYPVSVYYRIVAIDMLPKEVDRVIYLDVDTIVNHNLTDMLTDVKDTPVGACYDIQAELQGSVEEQNEAAGLDSNHMYFNSGVMIMDLSYMREHKCAEKLIGYIIDNREKAMFPDQDAFNYLFSNDCILLPWHRYNCPVIPMLADLSSSEYSLIRYNDIDKYRSFTDVTEDMIKKAYIIHYCTPEKPWNQKSEYYTHRNTLLAGKIYRYYYDLATELLK